MRTRFLLLAVLFTVNAFAQKLNVQSAADYLKKYNDLPKAKDAIDLAAVNESTSNDPKMWYYRGKIYLEIYQDTVLSKQYPEAPYIAATSFINCLKTDKGEYYKDDCNKLVWIGGLGMYRNGYDATKKGNLEAAARYYNQIFDVFPYDKENNLKRNNITPDVVNKNLYSVAMKGHDLIKAKMYLQKLIDAKFNEPVIYINMARIYLEQNDTAKALSYIDMGRKQFDDNISLMDEEARIYTAQNRLDELIVKLNGSIESVPDNEMLYYRRGGLYEVKKDFDKAIADYKKAVELKPDFMEGNYYIGKLYFNQAAELANQANNVKDNAAFNKAKTAFEAKFKESQPYLEKARELNTKKTDEDVSLNKYTLQMLKQLYVRTGQTEKYNEVKVEMEKGN